MTWIDWKKVILHPVIIWTLPIFLVGALSLVAYQMWRGDALVCADGSIFAKSCSHGDLPLSSGAVIAFVTRDGCPAGWTAHEGASGRFIVGVGRHSQYNQHGIEVAVKEVGDTGGEDMVKLQEMHTPRHAHRIPSRVDLPDRAELEALRTDNLGRYGGAHPRETEVTGDVVPHENMPPYIAFHLCKQSPDTANID